MSDRLKDLQRQRALVQEQLVWLEREIARETGAPMPPPPASPSIPSPVPAAPPVPKNIDAEAERILAQYRNVNRPAQDAARRGCLIFFFAGMTMLMLGLCAFLLWKYK